MRGRVAVPVFLLFLFHPFHLQAQCAHTLAYSGQFRATYLDLAIDGNDLWAATSYGVELFDRGVEPPARVASLAVPGTTRVIQPASGGVYAGSGSRIYAIRRSGKSLTIAGSVDAGSTVNDLLTAGNYLYAATSAGLRQYDLLNPDAPAVTTATFATTGSNVTSLALTGSLLYAADADSSVEVFSIALPSLPQKTGTIESLARSTSVKTAPGRIYVSDGILTDAFVVTGTVVTRVWTGSYGSTSLTVLAGDVVFAGGTDRRFRAIDWTTAGNPVEVFATDVSSAGGSVNRAAAMEVAGSRLYVAAGDAGLMSWDISTFTAPYLVRNYTLTKPGTTVPDGASSTTWVDGRLYAARASGGITELTRSTSGYLTAGRHWDSRTHIVHDGMTGFLLSSAGSLLTYWTLVSTTPVLVSSVTMSGPVTAAVLTSSSRAYVVLSDKTVWSVNLAQDPATATRITGTAANDIARSASGIVTLNARDDGTSTISWYAGGDMTAAPLTANVAGGSVPGVALIDRTAAIFTFNGIVLHDFDTGVTRTLPNSNQRIVLHLALTGSRVLGLAEDALLEWDRGTGALVRSTSVPVEGASLSVDSIAASGTGAGVMTVALDSTSRLPVHLSTRSGNSYYRKVVAAGDRLYLFDGARIDAFSTAFGTAPRYLTSMRTSGAIDLAATEARVFTLSSSAVVTAWSPAGVPIGQTAIVDPGGMVQPLAIAAAGEAAWVSIARGCTTSGCEKKTVVIDGVTLVRTATLDGGILDVHSAGGRAWATFDLPAEVRVYGISSPANPSLLASAAATGARTPVSISVTGGSAFVLGERLYTFPADTLGSRAEDLPAYPAEPPNGLAYSDQRIRTDGGCSVIVGRSFGPQFHLTGSWTAVSAPDSPSLAKQVAVSGGRIYVLTEHSLEVWSSVAAAVAPRRRTSR